MDEGWIEKVIKKNLPKEKSLKRYKQTNACT